MLRALYSGVSGLRVHQTKMDVIGNNIANVNTVGFKAGRVTFGEVFSQTLQGASGSNENTGRAGTNPMQIGLGTNVASIDTLMSEGASQRTDNALDLKIKGEGFFVISNGNGYQFSRAGAFIKDDAGNLATPEGYKVMGWPVDDTTGNIQRGTVQPLTILSTDNAYSKPEQTTKCHLEGNIVSSDSQLTDGGIPLNVQFYDNLGYTYTAKFKITPASSGTSGEYDIALADVIDEKGDSIAGASLASTTITFDTSTGKVSNGPSFNLTGLDTTNGLPDPLTIDFSKLTMYANKTDTSNIQSRKGAFDGSGAGREVGTIIGYSIGGDGKIVGKYSNGNTEILGQIVTTTFDNPAGLEKIGNNLFAATMNSGEFNGIGQDPTASGGGLNSGVLEMSNVDLSKEFTEMITTQRGFQANSRIITTSDEILQELVNLKR